VTSASQDFPTNAFPNSSNEDAQIEESSEEYYTSEDYKSDIEFFPKTVFHREPEDYDIKTDEMSTKETHPAQMILSCKTAIGKEWFLVWNADDEEEW
jgi:hypothetical protein